MMAENLAKALNKPMEDPLAARRVGAEKKVEEAYKPMIQSLEAGAEIAGAEKQMETQRAAQLEKEISDVQSDFSKKAAAAPQREQMKDVIDKMGAPFVPTQESAAEMAGLFSLINVIGFAIGAGGKKNAQQAMSAMNGMMEGYQQGRADRYKQEKSTFETNLKQLKTNFDVLDKGLKDAIETFARDRDAGMQKANVTFAQTGADFYKKYADKYGIAKLYEMHKQVYDTAQKALDKVYEEERRARERAQQFADQKKLKEFEVDLAERKMLQKMGSAGPRFAIYQATGKVLPSDKEASSIQSTSTALREIDSLRKRLQDPEITTGLQAYPASIMQKLKSLFDQSRTEGEVTQFVNDTLKEGLDSNDKTTLFIKDAILAGFKVEQGLTGSRVPVFTQKVVGPILDPRNYKPSTYDALLATREKDLYNTGADYGFSTDEMRSIARVGQEATRAAGQPAAGNVPAIGSIQDGYRFKGGNPADKNNWEEVK